MLNDAKEEIKLSNELWENSDQVAIREQMDEDFKYWGPYKFEMPASSGKGWTSETTTSGKTLGNKIKGLLQQSYMNLYIDILKEEREKNERIAATERLALGFIAQADRNSLKRPRGVSLQDAFSFYAAIHGGTACSVLLTETDGEITANIPYYDPYGCQYIEGKDGIIWFCYRENQKKSYLEKLYKKQVKEGLDLGKASKESGNGLVTVYTFWDEDEWKTAINGEYVDDDKHGLGHVPVFINPVGGVPPVMSEETDIGKYAWQSVYVNQRDLIPVESELFSIEMTKAKQSGRILGIATYDSTASNGQVPEEANKLVKMAEASGNKDNVVLLDKAKGQSWEGFVEAPDNRIVDQLLRTVRSYQALAGLDPVTSGVFGSGSGALANILRDAALEFTHPFAKNIEDTFTLIAGEIVSQFKEGNYPKVKVEGRDNNRDPFQAEIKAEDVEKHYFSCELVADRLRDEAVEVGLAIQEVKAGLSDKMSAIERHHISTNPARTMEMIEQEKHAEMAAGDPIIHYRGLAKFYADAGDDEMAIIYNTLAEAATLSALEKARGLVQQLTAPPTQPGAGAGGMPGVTAEAGRLAAEPMTEMSNSIQAEVE